MTSGYVKKQVEVLSSAVKAQYNVLKDKYGNKAPSMGDWRAGVARGFKAEELVNRTVRIKPKPTKPKWNELNPEGYNKHVADPQEYKQYKGRKTVSS